MEEKHNEDYRNVDIRLSGAITSLNPFKHNNSASRIAMDASHISQAVVLKYPDRMNISSGMDYNYADYLFDVRINGEEGEDVIIIAVLKKYSRTGAEDTIHKNPVYYVIYENLSTGVIDVSEVPTYYFRHMTFGFKYVFTDVFKRIQPNQILPAGEILATSPQYDADNQQYMFGCNALVAIGGFKEIVEDGFLVSESFAKKMTTTRMGTLSVNYGAEDYLLNLYGDLDNYKPFPDIGETIRPDGLVFATRRIDTLLSPVEMTPRALMEVDHTFDQCYYGLPNAKVVDITVYHNHNTSKHYLPTGMKTSPHKYFKNHERFYRELENVYARLKRQKGASLELSPHLHHLITTGMQQSHDNLKRANPLTYRKEELAQYRVTITYEEEFPLYHGSKLSSCSADKGVICHIRPDHLMPMLPDGRHADICAASTSSVHRMNPGRNAEQELNISLYQMRQTIRDIYEASGYQTAYDALLDYYEVVSPAYYKIIHEGINTPEDIKTHLDDFIYNRTSIYLPYGSVRTGTEHSLALNEKYPVKPTKITLFDLDGTAHESKNEFMVGEMYFVRLEKIGENWASTSVPRRQVHGIISKLSFNTKHRLPYRDQAIRFGETETRSMLAVCESAFVATQFAMANNQEMCNEAVKTILTAEKPSCIPELVDYSRIGDYPSVAVERIKHLMECYGLAYDYVDEREHTYDKMEHVDIEVANFEINNDSTD